MPAYSFFGQLAGYSQQQGSGFITSVNGQQVIVTNNHVIQGATNETVTFADGSAYPAKVLGSDPLADLAVLSITPMPSGLSSLTLVKLRYFASWRSSRCSGFTLWLIRNINNRSNQLFRKNNH